MAGRTRVLLVAAGTAIATIVPFAAGVAGSQTAGATASPPVAPTTIYDSTSTPAVPSPSMPFQAAQTSEFGNQVQLSAGSPRLLSNVVVTMDSWGCQFGSWDAAAGDGICTTDPGTSFTEPITLNLYEVGADNAVGPLLASVTQTFSIPYRPSSDLADCPDGQTFLMDGECVHGLPVDVTFDLGDTVVPDKVIWSVAYNTTSYGASPYGTSTSCFNTPIVPPPSSGPTTYDDCGYDSLNVLLTEASAPSVGSDPVPGTAYLDAALGGDYCDGGTGSLPVGAFRLDSADDAGAPCYGVTTPGSPPWYIPAAQFNAVPEVSVGSSDTTSVLGHPVTFTVTGPPSATHSVSVLDGAHGIGSCTLSGGSCAVTTSALGVGDHSITAVYGGEGAFPPFTSAAIAQGVATYPAAPVGPAAVPSHESATVSWTAPNDGDGPITGYTVTASPGGRTCTTATTSCVVTGLTDGTPYVFAVTATNYAGTGSAALTTHVTPAISGFHVYAVPPVVGQGHRFTISATGAEASSLVRLSVAGHGSRNAFADAYGAATATFVVSTSGKYVISALNGPSSTAGLVYVARVTVPTALSHRRQIPIYVASALPSSTLTITTSLDGTFTVPVSRNGSVHVDLPPSPPGVLHVVVSDNGLTLVTRNVTIS